MLGALLESYTYVSPASYWQICQSQPVNADWIAVMSLVLVVLKDRNAVIGPVVGLEVEVLGHVFVCDTGFFVSYTQTACSAVH